MAEQRIMWPLLDLRDLVLRRGAGRATPYTAHHVSLRARLRWGVLDAYDRLRAPFAGLTATTQRSVRPALLALLLVMAMGGVAYAAFSGGASEPDSARAQDAGAPRAVDRPSPPRIEVAGVMDSSGARAERRADRRAAKRRALRDRRADRRRAAARRRVAARRRAAARGRGKKRARANSAPVPASKPSKPETPTAAPAPAPAPTRPPASGGGSGRGGGSRPPRQPSNPGVEFDDQG